MHASTHILKHINQLNQTRYIYKSLVLLLVDWEKMVYYVFTKLGSMWGIRLLVIHRQKPLRTVFSYLVLIKQISMYKYENPNSKKRVRKEDKSKIIWTAWRSLYCSYGLNAPVQLCSICNFEHSIFLLMLTYYEPLNKKCLFLGS